MTPGSRARHLAGDVLILEADPTFRQSRVVVEHNSAIFWTYWTCLWRRT